MYTCASKLYSFLYPQTNKFSLQQERSATNLKILLTPNSYATCCYNAMFALLNAFGIHLCVLESILEIEVSVEMLCSYETALRLNV